MNRKLSPAALAAAVVLPLSPVLPSDPVGIYAVIDRVVLEPADGPAERAQLWGVFTLSGEGHGGSGPLESTSGGFYELPERGYLYYRLPEGAEEIARIEWEDMARTAGSGQCLAFASRYEPKGRVRPGCESPTAPDAYVVNFGLQKVARDTANPPPRAILAMPAPMSPVDGGSLAGGPLTLVARNPLHPSAASAEILFRLGLGSGSELSQIIPQGARETRWTPPVLPPFGQVHWSVQAVNGPEAGAAARACFQLTFLRGDANGDGTRDISDAVAILEFLFLGGEAPQPLKAADVDATGELDLSDGIYLLNFLFLGGPAPPEN